MNANTALVIIDVRVGIIEGFNAYRGHDVLDQINLLRAKARGSNVPIIYVQHDGVSGDPLEVGSEGWKIHSEIKPRDEDLIIHKRASDSFFETTLDSELKTRGIKRLVVAGCQTEYCV